jgi:hypothetical protein
LKISQVLQEQQPAAKDEDNSPNPTVSRSLPINVDFLSDFFRPGMEFVPHVA